MEVTINLPDKVFAKVANIASKSHRNIGEILVEKIEQEFSIDIEDLEKQIKICSDNDLIKISNLKLSAKNDKRLSFLLQKQNKKELSKSEQKELWNLIEFNRLTTLKKALSLREISQRKLIN